MKNDKADITSPKEPMSNRVTPLCNPKYSPTGKGGSKSEGPISKEDKSISWPSYGPKNSNI